MNGPDPRTSSSSRSADALAKRKEKKAEKLAAKVAGSELPTVLEAPTPAEVTSASQLPSPTSEFIAGTTRDLSLSDSLALAKRFAEMDDRISSIEGYYEMLLATALSNNAQFQITTDKMLSLMEESNSRQAPLVSKIGLLEDSIKEVQLEQSALTLRLFLEKEAKFCKGREVLTFLQDSYFDTADGPSIKKTLNFLFAHAARMDLHSDTWCGLDQEFKDLKSTFLQFQEWIKKEIAEDCDYESGEFLFPSQRASEPAASSHPSLTAAAGAPFRCEDLPQRP